MGNEQRTGWRVIAIIVLVLLIFSFFSNIGIALFLIGALLAFSIVNFGFRGWGGMRTVSNVVLLLIVTGAYLKNYFPLTSRMIGGVTEQVDVGIAKKALNPEQALEKNTVDLGVYTDSVARVRLDSAFAVLKVGVATKGWTVENKKLYDSLVEAAHQSNQDVQRILKGQKFITTNGLNTKDDTSDGIEVPLADVASGTMMYMVYDRRLRIVKVPPHYKVKLNATTAGYICDPNSGLVPSIEGMDYYPDGMQFKEGFPARNARVFCLLAKLDDQQPQAFVDGACTLYNETEDTLDCYVLVNDRNDWSDNSGSVSVTYSIEPMR